MGDRQPFQKDYKNERMKEGKSTIIIQDYTWRPWVKRKETRKNGAGVRHYQGKLTGRKGKNYI